MSANAEMCGAPTLSGSPCVLPRAHNIGYVDIPERHTAVDFSEPLRDPQGADVTAVVHLGDAISVLRSMPEASVDAVITDPPYFLPAVHYSVRKGTIRSFADLSMLEYFFRDVFRELTRVLRPTGVMYVFCDGQSYPVFYSLCFERFPKVRPLIWDKQVSINGYAWRHQHEIIMFAEREGAPKIPTGDGDVIVERAVPIGDREHLAQKPVSVLRRLVRKTKPSGIVLDPFTGSASTGVAALLEGREFIGIEMSETYHALAEERLRTTQQGYRDDGSQMVLGVEDGAA